MTITIGTTAVSFVSLTAHRSAAGVIVRWRTASQLDTLGFNVYREVTGRRVRLNARLISARGGGSHSFLDRTAPRRKGLRYWVEVVDVDGSRSLRGPIRIR